MINMKPIRSIFSNVEYIFVLLRSVDNMNHKKLRLSSLADQ